MLKLHRIFTYFCMIQNIEVIYVNNNLGIISNSNTYFNQLPIAFMEYLY